MSADVPLRELDRLGIGQRLTISLIRVYQLMFASMYAGCCRFTPSCSSYAAEAVRRYGVGRGGRLALGRLVRCRPFGGRGLDPVPHCDSSGAGPITPAARQSH